MKDRRLLMENDSGDFSIRHQCNLLGVYRGGLYYTPGTETEDNLNHY
jgi:hypothetical protein